MMSSGTRVEVCTISTTAPRRTEALPSYPHNFADSNRSAGRRRLPPPARRYSEIAVIAPTLEMDARSNSCSMATRSSRRRSKTSLAENVAAALTESVYLTVAIQPYGPSLRTVVRELHIQAEILLFKESDDGLQFVTIFAAHAHGVALYGCLHLALRILDRFDDILRLFGGDALLQRDLLTDAVV